jgi:sulfoxide reductase heme-binding subunit YedZ
VLAVGVVMGITEFSAETWGMPDERKTDGSLWQFNVATGSVALVLLVATLVFRPARMLIGRTAGPASLPWRRTLGIWVAVALVAHVPGGLAIHSSGWRIWEPFESILPWSNGRRFDEFTVGYWMGLLGVLLLLPLVLTSNDAAMRRLGARRWLRLHRVLTWAVYWVVAVHVVALQYGEFRNLKHVAVTASVFAVALVVRVGVRLLMRRTSGVALEPAAAR